MATSQGIRAGRAFVELFADDSQLVRGLRHAQKRLKAFGDRIRGLGLKMAGLGSAVLTPMLGAAKAFSDMGDQVAKMAKRTGLSVESLSELKFVASQTGTSIEAMETGLRRMQRSVYDAGRGLSTQTDALADLGLKYDDLAGQTPEDQFKLLAEAISRIEDPTRKAALAQALFGRAGTQLLPMFAQGARGIEELQQQARQLGLTMSGDDARAAEDFTDALDRLWKVVKMGTFRIGASLAPVLEEFVDRVTRVAVRVSAWIDQNRQLVVHIMKVAAAVLAGGIALAVIGTVISGLGSVMGGLIAIVTGAAGALGLLAGAVAFVLTPVGAVVAAVAALGAYLVDATNVGGRALDWLGGRFNALKEYAIRAYEGIGDALAAGDIALAARILWLSLKVAWEKGIAALRRQAEELRFGLLALHEQVVNALTKVWLKLWAALRNGWLAFEAWHGRQVESWANWLAKKWIDVQEGTGQMSREDAAFQRLHIDQQSDKERTNIARRRQADAARIDADTQSTLAAAEQVHQARMAHLAAENQERQAGAEAALDAARREWREALDEARRKRSRGSSETGPEGTRNADDIVERANRALAGLGNALGDQARKVGSRGTFLAANVLGLQAGDATDRMANGIDKIERNTRPLRNAQELSFA